MNFMTSEDPSRDADADVCLCVSGAPVVVSFAHFHLGDKKYADAIDGISPVHELHQTFLDLNPVRTEPSTHSLIFSTLFDRFIYL